MRLQTERARFLVECLNLADAAQAEDARWEAFQIRHLNDDGPLRIEDKSRQIGWSLLVAAEAVASAMLSVESTVFVSINLDEASEKVRYAKRTFEALEVSGLPKLVVDNVLAMEFDNGARILSLPSRPPRGKAKMNVVLDEFAHVQHDGEIYKAAFPFTTRGGRMRIGSSPMGARGRHWEISRQELRPYPDYNRVRTPWWAVQGFLKDGIHRRDVQVADALEMVERYGNERIRLLSANMALDDFQQEYCCVYVDEAASYFTWDLIRANQDDTLLHWHVKNTSDPEQLATDTANAIHLMREAISTGRLENVLVGGVDVGRKKHLTEIVLCGIVGDEIPVRLMVSLDRVPFAVQEKCIRQVLGALPVKALLIDQNGLGMQLAENLAEDTCAEEATFTNATKALWATELRIQMEKGHVPIPCDRDLAYQIHSVKKNVTAAKNVVFDTERNEKHHADKAWALALAVWGAREEANIPEWGSVSVQSRR